jgi:hypothetical protein
VFISGHDETWTGYSFYCSKRIFYSASKYAQCAIYQMECLSFCSPPLLHPARGLTWMARQLQPLGRKNSKISSLTPNKIFYALILVRDKSYWYKRLADFHILTNSAVTGNNLSILKPLICGKCPKNVSQLSERFVLTADMHSASRSQWPRCLTHEPFSPPRTLGSWVRIPLEAWMCK